MADMLERNNTAETHQTIWAANGSLIGSLGAIIGGSCCVLPLVLFNLGVGSSVIAQLGFFMQYRQAFLGIAVIMIVGAAILALRNRSTLTTRTVIVFVLAFAFVAAAYLAPFYEQDLLVLFGFRGT
ncbi:MULTISPECIES: hypothetical protein [Kordiimonas]|jgi:mercuric ion transport protein|uniref:hypothetical protein n=1 Tax=Kordiimonas TaxID=288021 RepID=UPI00257EEB76|nr:hypothetical protein [Kordiimonas sp. UBA4487]